MPSLVNTGRRFFLVVSCGQPCLLWSMETALRQAMRLHRPAVARPLTGYGKMSAMAFVLKRVDTLASILAGAG